MPNTISVCKPLCGKAWLKKHQSDHTIEDIKKLTMVVKVNGNGRGFKVDGNTKRGTAKKLIKLLS